VRFEREPNNAKILDNVFRLVHTIKGTCGFLGLPRLEMLAHAAETLMGTYRDGATVSDDGVSTILMSIDKIKDILLALEETEKEPEGKDEELINKLWCWLEFLKIMNRQMLKMSLNKKQMRLNTTRRAKRNYWWWHDGA